MPDHAISIATRMFAAMAGIGSVIRVLQNERFYRWHRRTLKKWPKVCSICSSLVLECPSTVRAVLFSILLALRDWRVGFLCVLPARVFVSRPARLRSNGREGSG